MHNKFSFYVIKITFLSYSLRFWSRISKYLQNILVLLLHNNISFRLLNYTNFHQKTRLRAHLRIFFETLRSFFNLILLWLRDMLFLTLISLALLNILFRKLLQLIINSVSYFHNIRKCEENSPRLQREGNNSTWYNDREFDSDFLMFLGIICILFQNIDAENAFLYECN